MQKCWQTFSEGHSLERCMHIEDTACRTFRSKRWDISSPLSIVCNLSLSGVRPKFADDGRRTGEKKALVRRTACLAKCIPHNLEVSRSTFLKKNRCSCAPTTVVIALQAVYISSVKRSALVEPSVRNRVFVFSIIFFSVIFLYLRRLYVIQHPFGKHSSYWSSQSVLDWISVEEPLYMEGGSQDALPFILWTLEFLGNRIWIKPVVNKRNSLYLRSLEVLFRM